MSLPIVYLINVALLTRLPLLLPDDPLRGRRALAGTAVQLIALLALAPTRAMAFAALTIIAINELAWRWEQRRSARALTAGRLVVLAVTAAGFAALCSPFLDLRFRSDLGVLANRAGVYFVPIAWLQAVPWSAFQACLLGALLCLNEANLVVRLVIETLELRPVDARAKAHHGPLGGREYNRGRIVGLLERLIVFFLVFENQYGALGLVMAAKGLARFKNLDDREFAEYFLIGTMLSIVLAGGIALIAKRAIQ